MRVLVELFDREPLQNVLGSCIFEPEIVVFLCDGTRLPRIRESSIHRLFRLRRLKTKPRFYYFDSSNLNKINRVLASVAADYPGCVFDFSGGRDLVLLAAGACSEALGLPGYYIDLPKGRFINVRGCAHLAARFALPSFTAEEMLALTGASVHGYGHFAPGDLSEAFEATALAVWGLVAKNPRGWADFVNWLQAFCHGGATATLDVTGDREIKTNNGARRCNPSIVENLALVGALKSYEVTRHRVRLRFASVLVKRCLLNQGIWLELYCYATARRSGLFHDVRTSVVVDWAGVEGGSGNTKNEVDVLLVKGITPVFISCKMSVPSPLALSEIMLLAKKFGREAGRAVVVCYARLGSDNRAIRQRAADLGIELIDRDAIDGGALVPRLAALIGEEPPDLGEAHIV